MRLQVVRKCMAREEAVRARRSVRQLMTMSYIVRVLRRQGEQRNGERDLLILQQSPPSRARRERHALY